MSRGAVTSAQIRRFRDRMCQASIAVESLRTECKKIPLSPLEITLINQLCEAMDACLEGFSEPLKPPMPPPDLRVVKGGRV